MDSTLDKDKYYNVNWLCSKASEMSSQNNNMLVKNTRAFILGGFSSRPWLL